MLNRLFGNKDKETKVLAPMNGKVTAIEEVPDPTFSEKMMGEGMALEPSEGKVVAPVDGEVVQIFPTNHAVGIKTKSGVELLIHIGLETVGMDGKGFEGHVKQGDKVKVGQTLVTFELALVNEKAASAISPIIVTNSSEYTIELNEVTEAKAGETELMTVRKA